MPSIPHGPCTEKGHVNLEVAVLLGPTGPPMPAPAPPPVPAAAAASVPAATAAPVVVPLARLAPANDSNGDPEIIWHLGSKID